VLAATGARAPRVAEGLAGQFAAWHGALEQLAARSRDAVRAIDLRWSMAPGDDGLPIGLHIGDPAPPPAGPLLSAAVSDRLYDLPAELVADEAANLLRVARTCGTHLCVVHDRGAPSSARPHWNFCRTRACPRCVVIRREQTARRMAESIEWTLRYGRLEGLCHVTLTQVSRPGERYRDAVERLSAGLERLFDGWAWRIQARDWFTCIEAVPVIDGGTWRWHVHAHVLVNATAIDHPSLRAEWERATRGESSVVWVTRKLSPAQVRSCREALAVGRPPLVWCKTKQGPRQVTLDYLVREACKYPQKMADLGLGELDSDLKLGILADWILGAKGVRHFRPRGNCRCRPPALAYDVADVAGQGADHVERFARLRGGPSRAALTVRTDRWARGLAWDVWRLGKAFSRNQGPMGAAAKVLMQVPRWVKAADQLIDGQLGDPRACWRHVHDDLVDPPGVHVAGDIRAIAERAMGGSAYDADVLCGLLSWAARNERGPP
jgi:hypothetical protein